MTSHAFGAFLDIESVPAVNEPDTVLSKTSVSVTTPAPTPSELDEYSWRARYNGPSELKDTVSTPITPHTPQTGIQTPIGLLDIDPYHGSSVIQSWSNPPINRLRVLTCCLIYMACGMTDSAPGALIPYMEKHYNIGYAIVSLIFVTQAAGFIGAAFFIQRLKSQIGQAKTYLCAQSLQILGFVMIASTPPYPVVVVAYFFIGWAMAISISLNNVYCANLADSTTILAVAQGAYGVGGTIGPFMATAMVSRGILWSRYYIIVLGICIICTAAIAWSFRDYAEEHRDELFTAIERTASQQNNASGQINQRGLLWKALKNIVTPIGALFTFAYQGAEVSISGWVISFLITERDGDPSKVGYVTAGFWGGITLGRFILAPLSARFNQKWVVHGLGLLAIAFQLLVWLVPNVVGNAVAVALVGFVLGPIAPCSMAYFVKLLPRSIQTTSVSFISSAGSSGGAVAPFMTGLLAQSKGTWVLHPICVGLFALMGGCWALLPTVEKRSE
jgi:fucose permease